MVKYELWSVTWHPYKETEVPQDEGGFHMSKLPKITYLLGEFIQISNALPFNLFRQKLKKV